MTFHEERHRNPYFRLALSVCNLTSKERNTNNSNDRNSTAVSTPAAALPPPPSPESNTSSHQSASATIAGGVLNGKAISKPEPPYPPIAKAAHASGTVVVQVLVDEDGKVLTATAVSGHPLLQAASIQAARQARFAPMKLSGKPVKVNGVLTYNFVAQ